MTTSFSDPTSSEGLPRVLTWSLLLLFMAPGFFFFLIGLGEVSEGECPLEECVGLEIFRFCGAAVRSADPGGSGTGWMCGIEQEA